MSIQKAGEPTGEVVEADPPEARATVYVGDGGKIHNSERQVLDALRKLPAGWVVIHSYRFSSSNEIDFVLLHRDHGLVAVEVKGGDVSCDKTGKYDTKRTDTGKSVGGIKDPYEQVHDNVWMLKEELAEDSKPWVFHSALVWFNQNTELPNEGQWRITLLQTHLADPESAILKIVGRARKKFSGENWYPKRISDEDFHNLVDYLAARKTVSRRQEPLNSKEAIVVDATSLSCSVHSSIPPTQPVEPLATQCASKRRMDSNQTRPLTPPLPPPPPPPRAPQAKRRKPRALSLIRQSIVKLFRLAKVLFIIAILYVVLGVVALSYQSRNIDTPETDVLSSNEVSIDGQDSGAAAEEPSASTASEGCHVVVVATLSDPARAESLAQSLQDTIKGVSVVPSAEIPGWSPGRWSVVSVHPSDEEGNDANAAAEQAGHQTYRTNLDSSKVWAC